MIFLMRDIRDIFDEVAKDKDVKDKDRIASADLVKRLIENGGLIAMLERPPTPAALRARRFRRRRRNGLVPRTIEVDEPALAEALIESGRLTEAEALRPDLVERELTALIADFILRWRNGVTHH